jgi:uncharacterized repeat protein (TIGR03803 family)
MTTMHSPLVSLRPIPNVAGRLVKFTCIFVFCIAGAIVSRAQTLTTLVSFDFTDGAEPYYSSVIAGPNGNLYGTTLSGGVNALGTVFEVTTGGELTTLYSFCSQNACADGTTPFGGLVLGTDGNFYGTTDGGGANNYGTVFQITPEGALTTIYNFCSQTSCADGGFPNAGLAVSKAGILYGTTSYGGTAFLGTIFSLTTAGTLTTLHSFCSETNCADGEAVYSALTRGSNGTFYGAATSGGTKNWGTIFSITPAGKFTTLHTFAYTDGAGPWGSPVQATNGILYGTTPSGGKTDDGTVFQLAKGNEFKTLYNFCAKTYCSDGVAPLGTLIQGSNGNLFGTTVDGGAYGRGTAFEITTAGVLKTLHSFDETDGSFPYAGLMQDSNENFYGTTTNGGDLSCTNPPIGCGTVFGLTP